MILFSILYSEFLYSIFPCLFPYLHTSSFILGCTGKYGPVRPIREMVPKAINIYWMIGLLRQLFVMEVEHTYPYTQVQESKLIPSLSLGLNFVKPPTITIISIRMISILLRHGFPLNNSKLLAISPSAPKQIIHHLHYPHHLLHSLLNKLLYHPYSLWSHWPHHKFSTLFCFGFIT
jgi:hypothetical protein